MDVKSNIFNRTSADVLNPRYLNAVMVSFGYNERKNVAEIVRLCEQAFLQFYWYCYSSNVLLLSSLFRYVLLKCALKIYKGLTTVI